MIHPTEPTLVLTTLASSSLLMALAVMVSVGDGVNVHVLECLADETGRDLPMT
jgi:hypothetical protein